jgi:putative ABC transport system permease protein
MSLFLAMKEVLRNKGRFFLFSLVIALITTLVLFIAALADGLALANREFFDKLDAELLAFQENVEYSAATSRIDFSTINDIERVEGVQAAGPIGLSNAVLVFSDGRENLDISLIGVEAGKPGDPPVIAGSTLLSDRGSEVVIDEYVASRSGVNIGDKLTVKTIQGSQEEFFELSVIGLTDGRQYLYAPSVFLPYQTWEKIKPGAASSGNLVDTTSNILAIKVQPGFDPLEVQNHVVSQVPDIEVSDKQTAIESLPGYSVQQNTLNTQQAFTLLIGILVIGGFFQIQMLQKVPLIGVMKAIGTSNRVIGLSVVEQIVLVTSFGVLLGSLATFLLALGIPDSVPVIFTGTNVLFAILTLLAIGPIGGLVSVRKAVSVEPLIALGLSS